MLLDDLTSYAITGEIQFSLSGNRVATIPFQREYVGIGLTGVPTSAAWHPPQAWKRVEAAAVAAADQIELDCGPDDWLYQNYYGAGTLNAYYALAAKPMAVTAAFDKVTLFIQSGSAASGGDGYLTFGLACKSQNFPF